jgi:hypothetical protein
MGSTVLLAMIVATLGLTAGSASAAASEVIGQWRFDEGSGQVAVDDGPFGLDGRLGTTDGDDASDPARVAGLSGGALRFDRRTFVRLPNAAPLEPSRVAAEAVVRADGSPGAFRYVVAHGAQGCVAGSYGLYTGEDGGLAFYIFDGRHYQVSAAAAPADVWNGGWHHVAGVFDGATVRLYVDGRPVGLPQPAPLTIAYNLMSDDSYLGSYEGTCSRPLRGEVDLVRLWNGPLAADFVGTLSDTALAPPTPAPPVEPTPESIPTATAAQSDGTALASRPALTPIAAGKTVTASGITGSSGTSSGSGSSGTATAPARACVLTTTTKRIRAGRRTVVTVRATLRGKPLANVKVLATTGISSHRLAAAKTTTAGRARLGLKPSRKGTITLKVTGRSDCGTTSVAALKALAKR